MEYGKHPARRIVLQLIVTTIIGLVVIALLTELVSWIARGRPAIPSFYTIDLIIIGIWFFVINGIYIGLHYYNTWQRIEEQHREDMRLRSDGLFVKIGKQDIKLSFDELAGLYTEGEYVVACNRHGKKYYLDESLEKIEKKLPFTLFFRLNRQYILNRHMVSGFRREENGKLKVLVNTHDDLPSEIQVSRTKAPAFKNWFQPN